SLSPASDGQFKAQVYVQGTATELYIAQAGRFNVEGNLGWESVTARVGSGDFCNLPPFTHWQIQTLLGAIGVAKGYDVWIPVSDRVKLDWNITQQFDCRTVAPYGFDAARHILEEIDVIWLNQGSSELEALFEVEHSTPIYS